MTKHKILVSSIAAIGVVCLLVSIGYMHSKTSTFTSFCDKKSIAITNMDNRFKQGLKDISLKGTKAASIVSTTNNDCMVGSGDVYVEATYEKSFPHVAAASKQVAEAVNSEKRLESEFSAQAKGSKRFLDLYNSFESRDGNKYIITYIFKESISCESDSSIPCDINMAIDKYDLLNRPIRIVQIALVGNATY